MRKSTQKGFTLIEILTVVAVIGILAMIIVVSLTMAREKARDAKRLSDIKQMASALALYQNSVGSYPVSATESTDIPGLAPSYVATVPAAPTPPGAGCDDIQNQYLYRSLTGTSYTLSFCIGGQVQQYSPGYYALTPSGVGNKYDVNGDGELDKNDPAYIDEYVVQLHNNCIAELCDVNQDGRIESDDASILTKILTGP